MSGLSGIAAVLAAVGLSAESKDAVPRSALESAINAALLEGEKAGVIKAGLDATKIAADATLAANARSKAILGHAEAKGREGLAHHLAFESEMSTESAVANLKAAPKGTSPSRLDGIVPDPKLAADENSGQRDAAASWDAAVSVVNKQAGIRGARA
jgi:hypothetical protein